MNLLTGDPSLTIEGALKRISESGEKCLVIVDQSNVLLGTLSDGDIRKAILRGHKINESIKDLYQKRPTAFVEGVYELSQVEAAFIENRFDVIPIVDKDNQLVSILDWSSVYGKRKKRQRGQLQIPVIIMAGGRGTRLEPFTKILPKPLIPIHEKPVIEHIIDKFLESGVSEFILSINYKARLMKAYFEELQPQYSVSFIEEQEPLGTAGCLGDLKGRFHTPILVTNCDVILDIDLADLFKFHLDNENQVTLVASLKKFTIPYGACELNLDGELKEIHEKPSYDVLANVGLYIMQPSLFEFIPKGQYMDMPKFLEQTRKAGKKIGVYPVHDECWFDVGQWAEYQNTVEKM